MQERYKKRFQCELLNLSKSENFLSIEVNNNKLKILLKGNNTTIAYDIHLTKSKTSQVLQVPQSKNVLDLCKSSSYEKYYQKHKEERKTSMKKETIHFLFNYKIELTIL
jgi:predicted nucleic-acid-binding Zn-ribbon protein